MKGDCEAASAILGEHQDLDMLGLAITGNYDTALHIAASAESSKLMEMFVEKLVNNMTKEQLELQNKSYNTALCIAAAASAANVKIVMTMVEKNRALLDIPTGEGLMPLYIASLWGQSEMMHFLYDNSNKMTGDFWTDENRSQVLQNCVEVDLFGLILVRYLSLHESEYPMFKPYFDVALKIVTDRPELTVDKELLGLLARKTEAFGLIKPSFFGRAIHRSEYLSSSLFID
ncbi:hypothetical protein L1887_00997 [Cichorium endivia]|nr:hypothetical protein L1887_00997 [Cichorium endivia]